jgi:hypothetical protein
MAARSLIRLAAPALFLGATAVFPALHQAFHHRDHDHAGGGIRFHRHEATPGHRHGAGPRHSHEAPADPADSDESNPRHGEGSLAHFAYALGEASPPPIAEISRPLESTPAPGFLVDREVQPGFFRPAADRGPPALSPA